MTKVLSSLLREREARLGLVLLSCAALGLALAQTPLGASIEALLHTTFGIELGPYLLRKPLVAWIDDGLMSLFFLLVGLEIRRAFEHGEFRDRRQLVLPAFAALGGMLVPMAVYLLGTHGDDVARRGWAIPAATDIAFALGALALLRRHLPAALPLLLLGIAVLDDLGAILLIALFYTEQLSLEALGTAAALVATMVVLRRQGVRHSAVWILGGSALWLAVLNSGVHATLAGVLLAFLVPGRATDGKSLPDRWEGALHPVVSYGALPLFAFANSGIDLSEMDRSTWTSPVTGSVLCGLVLGKPLGVLGFLALARISGAARLPKGVGWLHLTGLSCLCGIGFTMSLFLGSLAFESAAPQLVPAARLGVLLGSAGAGVLGLLALIGSTVDRPAPGSLGTRRSSTKTLEMVP